MQTIRVHTTQNVYIHYPIASLGDRIGAFLLDRFILVLYTFAVIASLVNFSVKVPWVWITLLGIPWLFYHLFFEIFMNGQTPGKRAVSIQVVRTDGTSPTIGNYLLRWLIGLVEFHFFGGIITVIVVAANGKGQRLGDLAAGTSVVKQTPQREVTASEVFVMADEDTGYTVTYPQVTQLSSQDIELIQRSLEMYRQQGNLQPVLVVTEKVKSLLGISTHQAPQDFLYTVVRDFNHLTSR